MLLDSVIGDEYNYDGKRSRDETIRALANSQVWTAIVGQALGINKR